MNEISDKLILRIIFTIFVCLALYLYKYAHLLLHRSSRSQLIKKFYPSKNPADTLHLFARILGVGLIYSEFYFNLSDGIVWTLIDFFVQSIIIFFIYLVTIYVVESIVLYNFEYQDEILKKKNLSYAIICFTNSLGLAYLFKNVLAVSSSSFELLLILWLFSMVVLGIALKAFTYITQVNLNFLIMQKNISIAFIYMGYFLGFILILSSSLSHDLENIKWYSIQVLLKILLSLIILPFFRKGIMWVFNLSDDFESNGNNTTRTSGDELKEPELGYGIYQGVLIFTSCFLTTVITGQVHFGNFYPAFN
jgi:uncharacterized membrane protein YjfL (UPF0719 family)